jgi:hypothetical protein
MLADYRVTRLGEPIGRLFTLGSYSKMAKVAHIFGLLFSSVMVIRYIILTKNGLGNVFTNTSGHPGRLPPSTKWPCNAIFFLRVVKSFFLRTNGLTASAWQQLRKRPLLTTYLNCFRYPVEIPQAHGNNDSQPREPGTPWQNRQKTLEPNTYTLGLTQNHQNSWTQHLHSGRKKSLKLRTDGQGPISKA